MPTMNPNDSDSDSDDDTEAQHLFEQYLRRFRPMSPPVLNIRRLRDLPTFAAAASVVAIITLTLVQQHSSRPPITARDTAAQRQPLTTAQLRAALLAGDDELNRQLDDASPKILIHSQPGTALYELGKE